jgi:transposase-like protein
MPKSPADIVSLLPTGTRLRWTRAEARAVVAAHEASGLSVEKFAAREGLKPARVARWMRKLKDAKPSAAPTFVEFQSVRPRAKKIEIVLRTGHVLFVDESCDPTSLRRVLELLERDADC